MSTPSANTAEVPLSSSFSRLLGIETTDYTADKVVCTMRITQAMLNRNGVLHGGALMTLSDTASGTMCFIRCPAGKTNITVESKTNFIRPVALDDTVTATCVPIHIGRSTAVIQITLTRGDGKAVGLTTQTHQFLEWQGSTRKTEKPQ